MCSVENYSKKKTSVPLISLNQSHIYFASRVRALIYAGWMFANFCRGLANTLLEAAIFELGVRVSSVLVGKQYAGGCQKPVTVGNKSIRICEGNLIINLHYPHLLSLCRTQNIQNNNLMFQKSCSRWNVTVL